MSRLKQLGKDSVIYGIGGVLAKSVSFFLLPVYTRIFSPDEYGTIEMLMVINGLLGAVLTMGMDSAQTMYFFKYQKEGERKQKDVVASILQWRLIFGIAVVSMATVFSPLINSFLFNSKLEFHYFLVSFSGALFTQILSQSAEVTRLLYRPISYISIMLAQTIVGAAMILTLVIVFEYRVFGFVLGSTASAFAIASISWFLLREYVRFGKDLFGYWPELIRFGLPLMPAGLAMYFMNTSDRWFIQHFHGEAYLGVFAVGAKFVVLLTGVIEIFRRAWWPIAMDAMHNDEDGGIFSVIARLYAGVVCAGVVFLTIISKTLVEFLVGHEFAEAWKIVGLLAWQGVFYGFFLIAAAGIWKAEKTYINLYLNIAAAVFGCALNYILVPEYGIVGASISTSLTYLIWIIATIWVSSKYWDTQLPYLTLMAQVSVSILCTLLIIRFNPTPWATWIMVLAGIVIVCLVVSSLSKEYWSVLGKKLKGI